VTDAIAAGTRPRLALPPQPYPGLRPFDPHEHRIFFGREEMIDAVIESLARTNLVVVHGASGSGKSSLVRAGVLPWLDIQQSGRRHWLTAILRPAGGPLRNLAAALADVLGAAPGNTEAIDPVASWHTRLALGNAVLDDVEAKLERTGSSLCVLIDQFEELFRYAKETSREEAKLLTELLCALASEKKPAPHLFVILTMRSDYLGECARFEGFAETVNACQYLLPRLNDFGLLRAIHEPATLYGGAIDPAVGDRLLFASRQVEDALPVLQHALMRACLHAGERHGSGRGWTVTLEDLTWAEGDHGALSKHAGEILDELRAHDPAQEKAAEWLFRSLTELDAEGRVIRRPRKLGELVAVAGGDRAGVTAVIEAFRGPGRNFLTANPEGPLADDTEIDVSHEALIRRWRRLSDPTRDAETNQPRGWMWREFEDGQRWRALAVQARVFRNDRNRLATLSPATTEAYASWWPEHTEAWAARYARDRDRASEEYREVGELWHASQEALEVERARLEREAAAGARLRFQRRVSVGAAVGALLMAFVGVFARLQREEAVRERDRSVAAEYIASRERDRADTELKRAQITQSLYLAELARRQREEGDAASAILLALAALPDAAIARPYVPEAELQLDGAWRSLRELIVLASHEGTVSGAAFSPDGKRIVTASLDTTARLWDGATGKPIGEPLKGHAGPVWSAVFSPDGKRIVTASDDKTARLWDGETGRPIGEPLTGHAGPVFRAAFSPDGRRIVTASEDKTVRLWDGETGKPIGEPLTGHAGPVYSAAFSPDGRRIVTASEDKTARLWDGATGKPLGEPLTGHAGPVFRAAFSPDGRRIVTASWDNTARLWDGATGKPTGEPLTGHAGPVYSAAFSPDGRRIVTASEDKTARLWDGATGKRTGEPLKGHVNSVLSAAFSPDGKRIVTASEDKTARLWDGETGKPIGEPLRGHTGSVRIAAFSPDSKHIVTVSRDNTARLWDGGTSKPIGEPLTGHTGSVSHAAFSPDGKRIVTASSDNTARLWDGETGKPIGEPLTGHTNPVSHAAFSPDGKRIVTAFSDNTARLWDGETGKPIGEPLGHRGLVSSAAFSPAGKRIVTASADQTARVWDAASGNLLGELKGHRGAVVGVAFSPDGTRIVTASFDQTARVWDAASGAVLHELKGHHGPVLGAAFSG
jgi:WD40 repeat protein